MGFASWHLYCTASSSGHQPNFAALNREHHLCSAGRPSRLALAHIQLLGLCQGCTALHPFNSLFSRTSWVGWYQKGKLFWILLEQEMMGWQWHQLDHMQIISTLLQIIMPVPHHSVFTGQMPFLPPSQSVRAQKAIIPRV